MHEYLISNKPFKEFQRISEVMSSKSAHGFTISTFYYGIIAFDRRFVCSDKALILVFSSFVLFVLLILSSDSLFEKTISVFI